MTGLEYLTPEVLAALVADLDSLTRSEIDKHPGGAQGYLRERNPQWRFVGRVTFHLAENKRDPDYPFAFLATFANGLTPQGKVKHEPLGRALQQYAGEQNREAMLNLLLPISKAAESSELIRRARRFRRDLSPARVVAEGRPTSSSRRSPSSSRAA